jgi:hypothetical protein
MTTQPVGTRRPASLARRCYGYAGQPVTWSSSRTSMTPFAIHPALTTASCPAQVRAWPVSVTMSCWVPASTSPPSGTAADSRSPGGTRHAGQVSHEL